MKTSLTKLKNSLITISLLSISLSAWAKPVVQIMELTGQVFAVSPTGKTIALKVNDHLEDKTEVMVEEGGTLTLNDYYDSTYHLVGGSHLKVFDKSVQLKRGKTWVQSQTTRFPLSFITANGVVDYLKSEFIVTFDQAAARSQVLVVNGQVEVSNILNRDVKQVVSNGSFTLIDPEVENGSPRFPTKVGLASLNTALSEFKSLPKNIKVPAAARNIASVVVEEKSKEPEVKATEVTTPEKVEAPVAPETKKGEIIFITTTRLPASVQGGAYSYFEKKVGKKNKTSSVKKETVPVHFYGIKVLGETVKSVVKTSESKVPVPTSAPRSPASTSNVQEALNKASLEVDQDFSKSLEGHSKEQPKNPSELQTLINDLQSY